MGLGGGAMSAAQHALGTLTSCTRTPDSARSADTTPYVAALAMVYTAHSGAGQDSPARSSAGPRRSHGSLGRPAPPDGRWRTRAHSAARQQARSPPLRARMHAPRRPVVIK